jgi:hypothetical protein
LGNINIFNSLFKQLLKGKNEEVKEKPSTNILKIDMIQHKKKNFTLTKTFDMAQTKIIFLSLAFDMTEWHTLFLQFYQDFDKDGSMTFERDEV